MLKMNNISKVYRTELVETHALRELDLHVEEGEFVAVTGPSGSGKTTFLNIAGLLESPSSGAYLLDGEDVSQLNDRQRSRIRNEKVGFIFQSFNLIPDLNLADNVDVPLRYRGWTGVERRRAVGDMLDLVGLGSRQNYLPRRAAATCCHRPGAGRQAALPAGG
jgi:putative ABC transport system ATP-binding protein